MPDFPNDLQLSSSRTPMEINTRNLVWKKENLILNDNQVVFRGNTDMPNHILEFETPYQFFILF